MSTICIKLSCIETSEIVGNDVYASSFLTIFRPPVERSGTEKRKIAPPLWGTYCENRWHGSQQHCNKKQECYWQANDLCGLFHTKALLSSVLYWVNYLKHIFTLHIIVPEKRSIFFKTFETLRVQRLFVWMNKSPVLFFVYLK